MRCYACNNILSTAEACARFKSSGAFTEMCNVCINASDLKGAVAKQGHKADTWEDEELEVQSEEEEYTFDDDEQSD